MGPRGTTYTLYGHEVEHVLPGPKRSDLSVPGFAVQVGPIMSKRIRCSIDPKGNSCRSEAAVATFTQSTSRALFDSCKKGGDCDLYSVVP